MLDNLVLLQKIFDFEKIMYNYLKKFPASEKYAMATEIKNTCFSLHKKIMKAAMVDKKKSTLYDADIELQHLKHCIRLSFELKFMSPKAYEISSKLLVEIGGMLGSWIRNIKEK